MSLIAGIALSRKTAAQAFITVEDFFGGFVVGALIGYSGSQYFEKALIPESAANKAS
jgi:F0F1-type ATP synthase assembly protein I